MKRVLQGLLIVAAAAALAQAGLCAIGRSRAVRPRRRRSCRPRQTGRREGRGRYRGLRHRHRHQVLQERREFVAPGDVPTRRAYAANRQTAEAMAAWRKAADKGSSSAMVELGVLYGTGAGVARDEAQARKLFERAAQAGNPRGVSNLAALGGGASSDPARARELLSKGAESNAEAQYQLGMMLAEGNGGARTTLQPAHCSRRRRRKIIPARWSGWARSRRKAAVGRRIPTPPKPITNAPQRLATKTQEALERLRCPYTIKDKRGNV